MAQLHRNPPFRAEHLGSLLRTKELLKVKTAFEKGQASAAELKAVEDRDIKDIVETQKKLGYPALSDGEYCRHSKVSWPCRRSHGD
jgi:methionine synthase II (cobalamin-independent)